MYAVCMGAYVVMLHHGDGERRAPTRAHRKRPGNENSTTSSARLPSNLPIESRFHKSSNLQLPLQNTPPL